jgi:predicted aconitase with swiveling domain
MELKGRAISKGIVEGIAIVSKKPFSFLGGVDEEGNIIDKESDIYGQSLKGKIFVFPYGRGSTVGSYVIYGLAKRGILKGIVNKECEPIVATGAILGGIPLVDKVDIEKIKTGDRIVVDGNKGIVRILDE